MKEPILIMIRLRIMVVMHIIKLRYQRSRHSFGCKQVLFPVQLAPKFTKMQTLIHGAITSYDHLLILKCDGRKQARSKV
jgi:hypothetical protein